MGISGESTGRSCRRHTSGGVSAMPMDRSLYPENWDELALAIKELVKLARPLSFG